MSSSLSQSSNTQPNKKPISVQLTDRNAFEELENNLLDQLEYSFVLEKTIGDDLLESLFFIYKNPLLEALNQIDKAEQKESIENKIAKQKGTGSPTTSSLDLVTEVSCSSVPGRTIYAVKGTNGLTYYLYESLNFCGCASFKHNVLGRSEFVYCKHVILVKLLKAMKKLSFRYVKESELIDLIKQI
jgi:hypothetical protein